MLQKDVLNLIDKKKNRLTHSSFTLEYVAGVIARLNDYIEGSIDLSPAEVDGYVGNLISNFTTSLYIPLSKGAKFIRARTYDNPTLECNISALSHIQDESIKPLIKQGRLNSKSESVYYGCHYTVDDGAVNVALSEVNAKPTQIVNMLESEAKSTINLYYVGIYDYIYRHTKPHFLPENMYDYFKEVYEEQQKKYVPDIFTAHILCDAFLSNVLRKPLHGNLYQVTSKIWEVFMTDTTVDGILYTSVKSEGSPVIALKPESVDNKLNHVSAKAFRVISDLGYGLFRAEETNTGTVSNQIIKWNKSLIG